MRRAMLLTAIGTTGCGTLVEDVISSDPIQAIHIESPVDGTRVLGRDVFPVEVSVECTDVRWIDVRFDDQSAGFWQAGDAETSGCSRRPGTRCVPVATQVPLQLTNFWPARIQAFLSCGAAQGEIPSDVFNLYLAPFDDLVMMPARISALLPAPSGGMIGLSTEGLHKVDPAGVWGLANHAPSARAFSVGADIYYYAPCAGLTCASSAPDLFRVDAGTLAASTESTYVGCAPSAIVPVDDQIVIVLASCETPRIVWAGADLADLGQLAADVRLTDAAVRRGSGVVVLGWRGTELVIVASDGPADVQARATGVSGALAALSDDGARAAVLDAAGRLSIVDVSTRAVVAAYTMPAHRPGEVVALSFAPGSRRVLVAYDDGAWWADESARRQLAPPDDDGAPLRIRSAVPLDDAHVLVLADPVVPDPTRRLVTVGDGATSMFRHWVGADWLLSAAPQRSASGVLYLAFDTRRGSVVVTSTAPSSTPPRAHAP